MARTIRHGQSMLARTQAANDHRRERILIDTREELRDEATRRIKAESQVRDLQKKCGELEDKLAKDKEMLSAMASEGSAYAMASELREKCDDLEGRLAEGEELILAWANRSRAYARTLDFLKENWAPRKQGQATAADSEAMDKKINEECRRAESDPIETQVAWRNAGEKNRRSRSKRSGP